MKPSNMNYQFLIKNLIWNVFNYHNKGSDKDIVIFTTRRSGGTWLTNIIESQKNIRSVNEPLSQAKPEDLKQKKYLPKPNHTKYLSLNKSEKQQIFDFFYLLFEGKLKIKNPWRIFEKNYSFFTNRQVIKLCHGNNFINDFVKTFDVDIIYLIRHPISQSLSVLKRNWNTEYIRAYLESKEFINVYLNKNKINEINNILKNGNLIEKHVLNWILENIIPLKSEYLNSKFLLITLEELIIYSEKIIEVLSKKYKLKDKNAMLNTVKKPSRTTVEKHKKKLIEEPGSNKYILIKQWQKELNNLEKIKIQYLLDLFDINIYNTNNILPNGKYLITK